MSLTIDEQRKRLIKICEENRDCIKCPIRTPCERRSPMHMPFIKCDKEIEEMAREVERMGML